jgi:hypothetical protein
MFANENPPTEVVLPKPKIDFERHLDALTQLAKILYMVLDAANKATYAKQQYNTHSDSSSPFISKSKWADEARKWKYITWRLERYYFSKLCALNSLCYKEITG